MIQVFNHEPLERNEDIKRICKVTATNITVSKRVNMRNMKPACLVVLLMMQYDVGPIFEPTIDHGLMIVVQVGNQVRMKIIIASLE